MGYLDVLFITMTLIFILYVSFIWIKYGVLPSISDSWRKLPDKQKILFTFYCWGFALPAMIIGLELGKDSPFNFLIFLATAGICFVGAASDITDKKSLTGKVHYFSAVMGIILSQLYILLVFTELWYISAITIVGSGLIFLYKRKVHEIWWIEILAFSSVLCVYGIELYF